VDTGAGVGKYLAFRRTIISLYIFTYLPTYLRTGYGESTAQGARPHLDVTASNDDLFSSKSSTNERVAVNHVTVCTSLPVIQTSWCTGDDRSDLLVRHADHRSAPGRAAIDKRW